MGEVVQLVQHGSTDLDDGELGGLRWMRRGREDAEVALDLLLGTDGVK